MFLAIINATTGQLPLLREFFTGTTCRSSSNTPLTDVGYATLYDLTSIGEILYLFTKNLINSVLLYAAALGNNAAQ